MFITVVGLNHKKAPVEIREKLAFSSSQSIRLLEELKTNGEIDGCVILSTCNRTEIYVTSKDIDSTLSEIQSLLSVKSSMDVEELQNYLYNFTCRQAITHLFRVAAGLDSMILGETEILGQICDAYEIALENSASNSVMNILFQKALSLGKKVHTETQISCGAVSVGYASVELVKQIFGDIKDSSILLIGAGEIGQLVAENLSENSISEVAVCNRSYERALELSSKLDGYTIPFNQLLKSVSLADIVVSCTSAPNYIVTKKQLINIINKRDDRPIFLFDLAVPRDIEPEVEYLKNVYLYNIDDLQKVVDKNLKERKIEANKAENIVQKSVDSFIKRLNSSSVVPVIKALRKKGEKIKNAELNKYLSKMDSPTEREKEILSSMANSIVNKLLHVPTVQLKNYAQSERGHIYVQVLRNLFDLSLESDEVCKSE